MDAFALLLLAAITVVLFVIVLSRRGTQRQLEGELRELRAEVKSQRGQLQELTFRVHQLEQGDRPIPAAAPSPAATAPPVSIPGAEALPPPVPVNLPVAEEPPPLPPLPVVPAGPTWGEQIRARYQGEEWEALVGGSLLNKLGALMLVIGIALFLGYTLTHLGPAGKVAVGFGISLTMLAAGVLLERQPRYKIFARGFLGGGWALLYFTAYAMYGLPAAQVIHEPAIGFGLLLTVAAGMVLHSLSYRSEVITGLTFFIAFITLTLFPSSNYGLVASVLLAAFLLFVAERFQWTTVVVAGLIFTYGAHALQFDLRNAPAADPWVAQAVLWAYWLLFEGFDLLRLRRQTDERGLLRTLLPLNACGFVGLASLPGSPVSPASFSTFLLVAAAAFLGSAVLRAGSLRADEAEQPETFWAALFGGGFESAITLTAAVMIAAFARRFSGTTLKVALLMEGEFLVLGGLVLGRRYLRQLGAVVLSLGVLKIVGVDIPKGGTRTFLGRTVHFWTPSAVTTAAIYYLNRAITRATPFYTWGGAILIAAVLAAELSWQDVGLSWMLFGALLLALLPLTRWRESAWQAALLLAAGFFGVLYVVASEPRNSQTLWVGGLGILVLAALTVQFRRTGWPAWGANVTSSAAVVLTLMWLVRVQPERAIALGWGTLALVLAEAGLWFSWRWLRQQAWAVAGSATVAGLYGLSLAPEIWFGVPHRVLVAVPVAVIFYYLAERTAALDAPWCKLYQYLATVLMLTLLGWQAGSNWEGASWILLSVLLLTAGLWRKDPHLRLQAYSVAGLASLSALGGITEDARRIGRAGPVIMGLYLSEFLVRRWLKIPEHSWLAWLEPRVHWLYSLAGTLTLSLLLFFQVSGERLTVAWGVQGVALLVFGFVARERVLRLSGLALFLLCISKLFVYDLRNLETMSRILSFIVLGLLLIGASWIYTRFRDQVRRLL